MRIVAVDSGTLNPGDLSWSEIETLGELEIYDQTLPDETVERAIDADIVLTNKVVLNRGVLARLPKLKFISVTATGYNVVDLEFTKRKGIPVSNVPVYGTDSVAQHVFAGLLSLIHRPEMHHGLIQDGQWERSNQFSFWKSPMTELNGKTMGIVGLGRIGMATARLANAFGMRVVANRRKDLPVCGFNDFEWLDLPDVFSVSDVVSLHCPQTEQNVGFVNRELLGRMKRSAILINTARGGLVNEVDLAMALNRGEIAGAFLDVVSSEPISADNPLLCVKNCLLTPHMAWSTIEARRRLMQLTAKNIAAFLAGKPINLV